MPFNTETFDLSSVYVQRRRVYMLCTYFNQVSVQSISHDATKETNNIVVA